MINKDIILKPVMPEPMVLTNPYKDIPILSTEARLIRRTKNNRKKIKRKKAKNGRRKPK